MLAVSFASAQPRDPAEASAAAEFVTPGISYARVDWRAALDQLASEVNARSDASGFLNFTLGRRPQRFDQRRAPALVQLNALMAPLFPAIGLSPVPVLLPFDVAAWIADRAAGAIDPSPARYQVNFRAVDVFQAGAAGYDAVFSMEPNATADLPARIFTPPVEVHLTGSLLTYDIADPIAGRGEPVKALAAQYPDLRRLIREGFVRYAFTRFGVSYVVSINCLDSTPRRKRLACREAYPVAERFLKALRVAGGTPAAPRANIASTVAPRPQTAAANFIFHTPGDIIPGSGYRGKGGHADRMVYSQIRFPVGQAPVYINSQLYRARLNCVAAAAGSGGDGTPGACREAGVTRNTTESTADNYAYPWRDNFCERRDFEVGFCPGGWGHQGQDLRPVSCTVRNGGSGGCQPLLYPVVAARHGAIIRAPKQHGAYLVVNERNEHVRFRYVHMDPERMDEDGVLNGRRVAEGEEIGKVANYQDRAGGTTTHLHFDIQVFTRDGWIWVNPYATLIASYEQLLGGRGRELPPAAAPAPQPETATPVPPEHAQEGAGQ
ncbi:MAG: M23 family peptidase [Xanthobacteraceae bacterium]|nr:MAG: M23 family peptidase [Xanthobacteraceae bacterium]